jgi:hypothetical protein
MIQKFAIPEAVIESDLDSIFSNWYDLALFDYPTGLFSSSDQTIERRQIDKKSSEIISTPAPFTSKLSSGYHEHKFILIDTHFSLRVPSSLEADLVFPILTHLDTSNQMDCQIILEVAKDHDQYLLYLNGETIDSVKKLKSITPMVHANIMFIAFDFASCLMGIHGAAVYNSKKCVVLPGASSAGKSTLAAALGCTGSNYCADELLLLTHHPVQIRPVKVSLELKAGSWKLLEAFYPKLHDLPIHIRADGKIVRYLPSYNGCSTSVPPKLIDADVIVFPRINGNRKSELIEIGAAQGLQKLTESGYCVHEELNSKIVHQLVDWIANIPCYELLFSDLNDARETIESLLS